MKRAIVGLLLVAGLWFGHQRYESGQPARVYRAFAEEILERHYDVAAKMTDGLTPDELSKHGSQERAGPGPEMFQTLFPSRFRIETEEKAADGTVTLTAVQTVLFNPQGVESALRPAMYAELRQVTSLKKTGEGWKVTSFQNEFLKMDSMTGR
jgi:hypothetical protein